MTSETIDKDMESMFQGNFMDASDIMGKGNVNVVIADVVAPNVDKDATGKVINRAIIAFKGKKKRFIVNKTNLKVIASIYGTKPSEWVDKTITLGVRYLEKAFGQRNVPTVRVIPPADKPLTFGMRRNFGSEKPFTNEPRGES